jgi:hypothetical protein
LFLDRTRLVRWLGTGDFMRQRLRLVLVVVGVAVGLVSYGYFNLGGKGVPKGNWYGTFTTPSGKPGVLHLVIDAYRPNRVGVRRRVPSGGGKPFEGTAQLCVKSPLSQSYELFGRILGSKSFATLSPTGTPVIGLRFTDLHVTWAGDTLTVAGNLNDYDGVTSTYNSANPDHSGTTTVHLGKGADADYEAACTKVG